MIQQKMLSEVKDDLFALLTETVGIQGFIDEFAVMAAQRLSTTAEVSCAIMLVRHKKAGTLAASDDLARHADEFQNRLYEGPCLQAAETHSSVYCRDTWTDSRWAGYLSKLDTQQIRSILGVPFVLEENSTAALNLYSNAVDAFSPADIRAAEALAGAASSSFRFAVRAASADDERHDLEAALSSRQTINTAVGIIMFQNKCSQAEALAILQRASSSRNTKLRLVAERVVAAAEHS